MRREIADVLETVKRAKDRDKGCTLLIGAGCSVKAGIPMASEFVEIIRKEYPRAYERAPEKTYPHVMAELLMSERRDLISNYINNAKINWAHLAIAQLLKHGFVDRVLTVNFDPLVMRACALVGVFPAVYDFAASQIFKPDFIAQQSIFHLHGQHTGLVVLNTESEVDRLSLHLGPLFTDSVVVECGSWPVTAVKTIPCLNISRKPSATTTGFIGFVIRTIRQKNTFRSG